jgi:hypothetical protein
VVQNTACALYLHPSLPSTQRDGPAFHVAASAPLHAPLCFTGVAASTEHLCSMVCLQAECTCCCVPQLAAITRGSLPVMMLKYILKSLQQQQQQQPQQTHSAALLALHPDTSTLQTRPSTSSATHISFCATHFALHSVLPNALHRHSYLIRLLSDDNQHQHSSSKRSCKPP